MVAIQGVAHFSIPVSDVAKSTRFYTEVVGCGTWQRCGEGKWHFSMQLGSA